MFVEDDLPFQRLRSLDVAAELSVGELKSGTLGVTNLLLAMNGQGGTYDVTTSFDVAEGRRPKATSFSMPREIPPRSISSWRHATCS